MAAPYARPRTPPGIYRAARAFRRGGTIAIVLLILFVGVVAYSAVQVVRSSPQIASPTVALEPNGTVGLTTSFGLTNAGYFPIQELALRFLVLNDSGGSLVAAADPPISIASGASAVVPVAIYLPLNSSAGASLLTEDQYLHWDVWGNATYGYLFAISIAISTDRSWGAPFDDLVIGVGAPVDQAGQLSAPVTIAFVNDATLADDGSLAFQVEPASGPACGTGSVAIDVPAGDAYNATESVPIAMGCDPSGGHVISQYLEDGTAIPLPPEAIP